MGLSASHGGAKDICKAIEAISGASGSDLGSSESRSGRGLKPPMKNNDFI